MRNRIPIIVTAAAVMVLALLLSCDSTPSGSNSTDPNWKVVYSRTSVDFNAVTWTGKQFVAVGNINAPYPYADTEVVVSSVDGLTWSIVYYQPGPALYGVAKAFGYVAVCGDSGRMVVTSDFLDWLPVNSRTTGCIRNLYNLSPSVFGMVGNGFVRTEDGWNWWTESTGLPYVLPLYGIALSSRSYVAVGVNGTVISTSAGAWAVQASATDRTLNALVRSDTLFVAVGDDSTIVTSKDGTNWVKRSSGVSNMFPQSDSNLRAVVWTGKQFVAVGGNDRVATGASKESYLLTSKDAIVWTRVNLPTNGTLDGVAWSGTRLVVVDSYGNILASPWK